MGIPEHFQKLRIADLCRIIIDLKGFGVISEIVVGWIGGTAASITDASADNTFKTPEPGVRSPKSAHSKSCCFQVCRMIGIQLSDEI